MTPGLAVEIEDELDSALWMIRMAFSEGSLHPLEAAETSIKKARRLARRLQKEER